MRDPAPGRCVTSLIGLIGSRSFPDDFFGVINGIVRIDHCTVFMADATRVRTLVARAGSTAANRQVQTLARHYADSAHSGDPVWCRADRGLSCWTISPAAIRDPAYRREFYDEPNVLEELALSDIVGGRRIYVGYYREHGHGRFSDREIETLAGFGEPTLAVLGKQAELSLCAPAPAAGGAGVSRDRLLEKVLAAISANTPGLTPREAEICAGIVLGYTALGLSLRLGISTNTVATHRKRAYAKLRISSQSELFACYFGIVDALRAGA